MYTVSLSHTYARVIDVAFFVASILVLFFNVGIPNELKGCLFFIQVNTTMYVHLHIVDSAKLNCRWLDSYTRAPTESIGSEIARLAQSHAIASYHNFYA